MSRKKSVKREITEWVLIIGVSSALYMTGYHKTVISFVQRGLLATGILQPDLSGNQQTEAPFDFKLVSTTGKPVDFAELKGRTIFMNFWATWCAPCLAEMPDIHALYDEMKDEVEFVMVSVDKSRDKAIRFVENKDYKFPVYFASSPVPKEYKTSSIPTTLVISPDGNIVTRREGMAKYNTEAFRNYLRKL